MNTDEFDFHESYWARPQRRLKVGIYAPLLLALLLEFARAYFGYVFEAFALRDRYVLQAEVICVTISVVTWLYRYLQYGIGLNVLMFPLTLNHDTAMPEDSSVKATASRSRMKFKRKRSANIVSKNKEKVSKTNRFEGTMSESRDRLLSAIERQARNNSINLIFGVVSTIAGIWILYTLVLGEQFAIKGLSQDPLQFALRFLPKFTLVFFVELFAYFFLGLYRKGLSDIKYFQNEITNIESKGVALKTALSIRDRTTSALVIEKIANTERNHVLERGQTTIELELARSEKASLLHVIKALPALGKVFLKEDEKDPKLG